MMIMESRKKILNNPPKGLTNPSLWSNDFNDFVQKCLIFNPAQRPTATQLLNHSFIQNNNQGKGIIIQRLIKAMPLINKMREEMNQEEKRRNNGIDSDDSDEEDDNRWNIHKMRVILICLMIIKIIFYIMIIIIIKNQKNKICQHLVKLFQNQEKIKIII